MPPIPVYGDYAEADVRSELGNTSLTMMNAWINFAWTLNPNGANGKYPTTTLRGIPCLPLAIYQTFAD